MGPEKSEILEVKAWQRRGEAGAEKSKGGQRGTRDGAGADERRGVGRDGGGDSSAALLRALRAEVIQRTQLQAELRACHRQVSVLLENAFCLE